MPSAAERSRSPNRHSHRSKSPIRRERRTNDREKETSPKKETVDRHPEDEDSGRKRSRHRSKESFHRSREQERHRSRETEKGRYREVESGRRPEKDGGSGSKSKRKRSVSPIDREQRNVRTNSDDFRSRGRDEEVENSIGRRSEKDGGSSSRSKHRRSVSPIEREQRNVRTSSDSPPRRDSRSRGRDEVTSPRGEEHRDADDSIAKMKAAEEALEAKKKEEPSYELSGKLAAETNRVKGVTLLFTEPSDARKSDIRWRLYVFKGGEMQQEPLYIHRQTCYLFGRERRVADVPTDHPSCSKQHAVIQFRQVEKEQPDGMLKKQIGPYLMDLGSTNGTFLNETRIEAQRYYELFEKDTIKFGNSSREYVMLHENSAE